MNGVTGMRCNVCIPRKKFQDVSEIGKKLATKWA